MAQDSIVSESGIIHNRDFPWDDFDSWGYYAHNYRDFRDDDRQILELVRDFFAGFDDLSAVEGIDVGSGANLYPALALLPFCEKITLWEYSLSNVNWLRRETDSYSPSWDAFWEVLRRNRRYREIEDPRQALRERVTVLQGDLFHLPKEGRKWDIGTMFFVAESLTRDIAEFEHAIHCFLDVLKPDAPFAIALMENSEGYEVGGLRFPAVAVGEADVRKVLEARAYALEVKHIDSGGLRTGYSGMLLALGRRVE